MRLVHFADSHLGYRQFDRLNESGQNRREADVAATFRALVDHVIEIAPDLIIIAGDNFHVVRPANGAVIEAFSQYSRLVKALPLTKIIMVAGNHDSPASTESVDILGLFAPLGIHVVNRHAERLAFPTLDLSVLAVPDVRGMVRPSLVPDPAARFNVLCLHGEVHGMPGLHGDRFGIEIPVDDINPPTWDYIGLGHYHVYQQLAPNMYYSGSIDYTSSNPWGELTDEASRGLSGKGFAERNLLTGEQTFHALPRSRDFLDLTLSADGMSAEDLSAALRELLEDAHPDETVCRVVVTECERETSHGIDAKMIREFKRRALNLNISFRRPEVVRVGMARMTSAGRSMATIEDMLTEFLAKQKAEGRLDTSLEAITATGLRYLDDARAKADEPNAAAALAAAEAA